MMGAEKARRSHIGINANPAPRSSTPAHQVLATGAAWIQELMDEMRALGRNVAFDFTEFLFESIQARLSGFLSCGACSE